MSVVYTPSEVLVAHRCGECGVWFGLTEFMLDKRRKDGKSFYCPNGHSRAFRETEAMRLQRQLDDERQRRRAAQDLLHAEERSHTATRGHLTRQKKRAANGVCPCCNRTFKQLAAHMKNKHPEYVKEAS